MKIIYVKTTFRYMELFFFKYIFSFLNIDTRYEKNIENIVYFQFLFILSIVEKLFFLLKKSQICLFLRNQYEKVTKNVLYNSKSIQYIYILNRFLFCKLYGNFLIHYEVYTVVCYFKKSLVFIGILICCLICFNRIYFKYSL